jgi:hypothetical protein
MSRAKKFVEEALLLIGEADDPNDLAAGGDEAGAEAGAGPDVIDDTAAPAGDDDLDLGAVAEPEDEFGLGGSVAPTVRVEKDGPITVNKGDVQLSIGDDGNIDISLDGGTGAEAAPIGDMTDKPADNGEESPEEDDYNIDWEKEKEGQPEGGEAGAEPPAESLKDKGAEMPLSEDLEGQTINQKKQQSPATTGAQISKAASVLNMDAGTNSGDVVAECTSKQYECMSCECYDNCIDKKKKPVPAEEESDFLTQGFK